MRNAILVALGLVGAALVLSGPTVAQQIKEITGTVDVGNLPLDALGNVLVSGVLRNPQRQPLPIRFVGFTQAQITGDSGAIMLSRTCHAEFPGTRQCTTAEIVETISPPLLPEATGWVRPDQHRPVGNIESMETITGLTSLGGAEADLTCIGFAQVSGVGIIVNERGQFSVHGCGFQFSVACCGPVLVLTIPPPRP